MLAAAVTNLLRVFHGAGYDLSKVVEEPAFYLFLVDKLEVSQKTFTPTHFRRLLNRVLNQHCLPLPDDVVLRLQDRIRRYGRSRWGFQVVLSSLASTRRIFLTVAQVEPMWERPELELYNKAFKYLEYIGHLNAIEGLSLQDQHPRLMAIEMCEKVHAVLADIGEIAFTCFESDYFVRQRTAVFANRTVQRLTGVNHEEEFNFLVDEQFGESFHDKARAVRVGQVARFGAIPVNPHGNERFYSVSYCYPFKGLLFMWGYTVDSLNAELDRNIDEQLHSITLTSCSLPSTK